MHEPGLRWAGVVRGRGGRGLEEGLAAAIRRLRLALRQVRVRSYSSMSAPLVLCAAAVLMRMGRAPGLDWMGELELVHAVRLLLSPQSSPFTFRCFATLFPLFPSFFFHLMLYKGAAILRIIRP